MNINSKSKITLTIKQLKDLISESSMKVAEDIPSKKHFRAQDLYKYGFTHDKKDDFSDDGNYFFVYRLSGTDMGVSYLRHGGTIYLAGTTISGSYAAKAERDLDYHEYSRLPGYDKLDKYNGVLDTRISSEDIKELVDALKTYEKALIDAFENIQGVDQLAVDKLNDGIHEIVSKAYNSCKEKLVASIDAITKNIYTKNFGYNLKELFNCMYFIKIVEFPIKGGSKSAYDRERIKNPDKILKDAETSISRYIQAFDYRLAELVKEKAK